MMMFLCGKNCFVIVAPHELIIWRSKIKEIKASTAIDVIKPFNFEMDKLSIVMRIGIFFRRFSI